MDPASFRLKDLTTPLKLVISLALLILGLGYSIAMVNLYLTYSLTDGEPGLTASDLQRAFYGNRDNTKLAAKIHGGSMEQFLPTAGDKEKILSWIQDGVAREAFTSTVEPIMEQNCVRCHNPEGLQRFAPLTSYEEVMVVTQIDRGEPVSLWVRVAHTHLQSIGLIFLVLGTIFSFTSWSTKRKSVIVIAPFAVLVIDFGARFLARYIEEVVYLMMVSGAVMAALFGIMVLVPLYEIWIRKPTA